MPDNSKRCCPSCKKEINAKADQTLLPFCSKKCKMADLGKWFSEEYSIPSNDLSFVEEDMLEHSDDK